MSNVVRADTVGSLLRPDYLLRARAQCEAGELAPDLTAEPLDHVTSLVPSSRWATSSVWAGSPGNAL